MRKILQNQQLRQLEIVEFLLDKQSVLLKDVSQELYISEKTIRKDIRAINHIFSPIEISANGEGISLVIPNNYSIDFIYSCFLEQSLEYSIAEYCFFYPNMTIEKLAKEYQVSDSTIRRTLNRLNSEFKKHDFELSGNPIIYSGDELHIIMFISALLKEKYTMRESIFPIDQFMFIQELIHSFYKKNKMIIDDFEEQKLTLFVLTSIKRRQQNTMKLIPSLMRSPNEFDFTVVHDADYKMKYSLYFNRALTEDELAIIFWIILNKTHVFNDGNIISIEDSLVKRKIEDYRMLVNNMKKRLGIAFENADDVALEMYNLVIMKPSKDYILHDPLSEFEKELRANYFDFNYIFDEICEDIFPNDTYTTYQKRYMKYQLFTQWSELYPQLKQTIKKPRVAIISNKHTGHADFLYNKLKYIYKDRIDIEIFSFKQLSIIIEKTNDFHILVTSIQGVVVKNGMRVINFSIFPTSHELYELDLMINEVKIELTQES